MLQYKFPKKVSVWLQCQRSVRHWSRVVGYTNPAFTDPPLRLAVRMTIAAGWLACDRSRSRTPFTRFSTNNAVDGCVRAAIASALPVYACIRNIIYLP